MQQSAHRRRTAKSGALRRQPEVTERGFVLLGQWVLIKTGYDAGRQAQVVQYVDFGRAALVRPLGRPEWVRACYLLKELELDAARQLTRKQWLMRRWIRLREKMLPGMSCELLRAIERRCKRIQDAINGTSIIPYTGGAQ